ncbi:OmpA family protein [Bacteroides sp. 224]|uniref:OmpA family protein n=1 Tax=Bacteroides sp. 224 TaxID=2302936 RepID=UPI0013D49436|nr:OmpA family protein [Bacteroides sp. 224]NDV67168.1 OmpA family protein [Bacteroides sp. 224]
MKSKIAILSLMMAGAAVTATAQTKEKFFSEKFGDNIFISVGGGAQVSTNGDNFDNSWTKAITPKVTLSLGKWFSPVWGLRGQATGWETAVRTDYGNFSLDANDKVTYGEVVKIKKHYATLHADALFNLSNAIGGYNPDRLFTLSIFGGPGLTFGKMYNSQVLVEDPAREFTRYVDDGKVKAYVNGSVGLLGMFNVSKYIDINIEARGELAQSQFGKLTSASTDGAVSLTAGLTYTFGGKKFVNCNSKIDQDAINAEINKYRKALAEAEDELARTKNALANAKGQVKEVTKEVQVVGPRAIFFMIGKTNIDDYGMVNVKLAAKIIKANPDKKYKVAGYADKATGSSSWNQKLSEKRAQNVYDALIKEGVSASQLEYVGFGGTANMFDKDKLNRVVILE